MAFLVLDEADRMVQQGHFQVLFWLCPHTLRLACTELCRTDGSDEQSSCTVFPSNAWVSNLRASLAGLGTSYCMPPTSPDTPVLV